MEFKRFIQIALSCVFATASLASGQSTELVGHWDNRFGPEDAGGQGANQFVLATAVHPLTGDVFVGGALTSAGDVSTFRIGRWDGSKWHSVGDGLLGQVKALTFAPDGTLYAAGHFLQAEQADGTIIDAAHVAKWDGVSWSPLGRGLSGRPASAVFDANSGYLYVAGDFDNAINADSTVVAANNIAVWDGIEWRPLGLGSAGSVTTVAVSPVDGQVIIGGQLVGSVFNADSTEVGTSGMAAWDGTSWTNIGGPDFNLNVVTFDEIGQIYVGGSFSTFGGQKAKGLARYNGSTWESLGGGIARGTVFTILPTDGGLFVGGNFSELEQPDGSIASIRAIAYLDLGTGEWSPLRDGLRSSHFLGAYSMVNDGDDIFVGGRFQSAGGHTSNSVARWIRSSRPFPTTPVRFAVDMRPAERFNLVRDGSNWTPHTMLEVLSGELSGVYYLSDDDRDGVRTLTIDQPAGSLIDYMFFVDQPGQAVERNNWVRELNPPSTVRSVSVPTSGTAFLPAVLFDDRDPIGPPAASFDSGIQWLWEGRGGTMITGPETHDTFIRVTDSDRTLMVGMWESREDPGGDPPAGILQVSNHILWRLEVWPAAAQYSIVMEWNFDEITGVADPTELRLLRRPHPDSAWILVPTEVDLNAEKLITSGITSLSGEWTVGSISNENVLTDLLPPVPANPHPGDGTLSAPIRPTLRWDPSREATSYEIFLWETSTPLPPDPTATSDESAYLTEFLVDGAEYNWQVRAHNINGLTDGPVWTFRVGDVPDLVTTSIESPPELFSGQPVEVAFTVTNSGDSGTNVPRWDDEVFISASATFDRESAVSIGSFPNLSSLNPGEHYTNRVTVELPRGIEGSRYLHVLADAPVKRSGRLDESGSLDEIDETNNNAVSTVVEVSLSPFADLEVVSVVATDLVFSGDSIDVTWTVENRGTGQTDVESWYDTIFLSDDDVFNFGFATSEGVIRFGEPVLGSFEHAGTLESGDSYSQTRRVALPEDAIGDFHLFVYADIRATSRKQPEDGDVYEFSQNLDNWTEEAISITLTPPPDLTVTQLTIPESAESGQLVDLSWIVENQGPGFTGVETWADIVYFSPTAVFDSSTAQVLKSVHHRGALANDASYSQSASVRVPDGVSGAGYFFVETDWRKIVFEHTFENNNLGGAQTAAQITLGPYPDLHVAEVRAAQTTVAAGRQISVTYRVKNEGVATVSDPWVDSVFVLGQPLWDRSAAEAVLGLRRNNRLDPGDELSTTIAVEVPSYLNGPFYVFVFSDVTNTIYELPDDYSNLGRSQTITATEFPAPDLVGHLTGVPDSAGSGMALPIQAAVTNQGEGRTLIDSWTDQVFLSVDNTLDRESDDLLSEFFHEGGLPAGASYDYERPILLPNGVEGLHFLIFAVDAHGQASESTLGNNTVSAELLVTATPPADLQVTDIDVSAGLHSGQQSAVSWRTENAGSGITPTNNWYDAVYLSADRTLDRHDPLLATFEHTDALAAGASRTVDLLVSMPAYAAGPYYLIVETDHRNEVYEQLGEVNNLGLQVIELELAEPSDLIVESIAVPSEASPGDSVIVSWTVKNVGPNPARGLMREVVSVSIDETSSEDDRVLGVIEATIDLAPGESSDVAMKVDLTQTVQIDTSGIVERTLPGVIPGDYFALVRTDAGNSVRETDNQNNTSSSPSTMTVSVPELALGVPTSVALSEGGSKYFQLTMDADSDLRLTLQTDNASAGNEIYVAFDRPPTPAGDYDFAADEPFVANQELIVPSTQTGTYYVVILARNSPGVPSQNVTLLAEALDFSVTSISPARVGQSRVTATLSGAGFRSSDRIFLSNDGTHVETEVVAFVSTTELSIRLQGNTPIGVYDVVVERSGGEQVVLEQGIEVESDRNLALDTRVIGPDRIRADGSATYRIEVSNPSNVDVPYMFLSMRASRSETVRVDTDLFTMSEVAAPDTPEEYLVDYIRDEDGSSIIPVIARDLTPGSTVAVHLEFSGFFVATFDLLAEASALSTNQALEAFKTSAELTRQEVLAQRDATAPVGLADDEEQFSNTLLFNLFELGLIDADALEGDGNRAVEKSLGISATDDSSCPCVEYASSGSSSIRGECIRRQCPQPYPDIPPDYPDDPDEPDGPPISCDDQLGAQAQCFERWQNRCESPGTCLARGLLCAAGGAKIGLGGAAGGGVVCWLTCVVTVAATEICDPNWTISVPRIVCPDVDSSCDPNDIIGPDGFSEEKWVAGDQVLPYKIRFENDPVRASASAQVVGITHPLDPTTDPRSFRLGSFGFGSFSFEPPANTSFYRDRIDVSDSLGVEVDVAAGIDVVKNEAFWRFTSIDPTTGDQPRNDPAAGFLPVNDESGVGEGFVSYTVVSSPDASTGDVIDAQADIIFDINPPLQTPAIFNTVDNDPPVSAVNVIGGRQDSAAFQISWTGRDEGSGVRDYALYSSIDGDAFEPVDVAVSDTSYLFVGELGHRYRFFTIATDNAGNTEPLKTGGPGTIVAVEEDEPDGIPKEFALHQNYPNPFNPSTTIPFDLPENGSVEIVLYDIMGRQILAVDRGELQPGKYQHLLNLSDFASGVYLYQIRVTGQNSLRFTDVGKLVLVK